MTAIQKTKNVPNDKSNGKNETKSARRTSAEKGAGGRVKPAASRMGAIGAGSTGSPSRSKGLGKGLGALLETIEMPDDRIRDAIMELKITDITPNSEQPRKRFDQIKLEELAASVKENGIIQPIIVCRNIGIDGYRIVAGERRWRAARLAGLNVIPAIVRDLTDLQILEHALIENIQRQDLNPIEER